MPRGAGPQVPRGRRAAAANEHAGIPVGPGEVARGSAEVPGPRVRVGVPRREERCPEPLDHGTLHDIVATRKARRERRVGGAGAAADGGPARGEPVRNLKLRCLRRWRRGERVTTRSTISTLRRTCRRSRRARRRVAGARQRAGRQVSPRGARPASGTAQRSPTPPRAAPPGPTRARGPR